MVASWKESQVVRSNALYDGEATGIIILTYIHECKFWMEKRYIILMINKYNFIVRRFLLLWGDEERFKYLSEMNVALNLDHRRTLISFIIVYGVYIIFDNKSVKSLLLYSWHYTQNDNILDSLSYCSFSYS